MAWTRGWIGVDLDGTLAFYDGYKGPEHIGDPIPLMEKRVKGWIAEGKPVKIFTARADDPVSCGYIKAWLLAWGFGDLEITNVKDMSMIQLWDDRCVQVVPNTGQSMDEKLDMVIRGHE